MYKPPKELCDHLNLTTKLKCVRHGGHKGNCWSRWEPEAGFPGALIRRVWSIGAGMFDAGYLQRRVFTGNN